MARNTLGGNGRAQADEQEFEQDAAAKGKLNRRRSLCSLPVHLLLSVLLSLLPSCPVLSIPTNMPHARTTRSTRAGAARLTASNSTSASINRQSSDAHHLRLTVKAPPSKLRQAISGDDPDNADDTPEPPVRTARSTRNPRTVLDNDSEEEDQGDDDDDDEAEGEDDAMENTDMMDAEGSDEDADADADDIDMDPPHPPPPVFHVNPPDSRTKAKANVTVSAPPHKGNLKSVEAKELDDDDDEDDDDELSDLQSGDDDLPGVEDDDDEELDSELEGADGDATPDMTKLTRRQRAAYEEEVDNSLMALSNEAQKKKHLTAEEHAMRRAEMARRRKNLSEKRNEEEKVGL